MWPLVLCSRISLQRFGSGYRIWSFIKLHLETRRRIEWSHFISFFECNGRLWKWQFRKVLSKNWILFHEFSVENWSVKICEKQRGLNGVAAWDPHHASRAVAAAAGHYVKCFDTRDKKETWSIGEGSNVKSIDFNPNKQNQLSIGGEDGEVRFYDVR